jgi:hypothetical protein
MNELSWLTLALGFCLGVFMTLSIFCILEARKLRSRK